MAGDLTSIQATQAVKIVGSGLTGAETTPVNSDINGNLLVKPYSAGSAAGGAAAPVSDLSGGLYNTALPVLTNGQQAAFQLDSSGRIIIRPLASGTDSVSSVQSGAWTTGRTWVLANGTDSVAAVQSGAWTAGRTWTLASGTDSVTAVQGTSPWVANVSQFGGSAVATGTGASGAGIPRVTVANDSNILATQSGTWTTGRTWTISSGTDSVASVQSGTWTVQPGNTANTVPWLVTDSSDGPVIPGTVAGKSSLAGGQFNTALPVLSNTQQSAIQLDASGRLIIRPLASGTDSVSAVQSGSWTTGRTWTLSNGTDSVAAVQSGTWTIAPLTNASIVKAQLQDNAGTAITLGQKVMASSIPIVIASDQSAIPVTQSGAWTTGRTWTLASGTDSVAAVQSGTWTIAPLTNSSVVKAQLQDNAGTAITLGQKAMASSVPIVIASDQSAIPVSQSGTWTVQPGNTANTTPWLVTARLNDGSGNSIASTNSQLQTHDIIDTAGQYRAQSVTTSAAEALGAGTILANRKSLTVTPTNGTVYWGYSNAVTTTTGTPIFKNQGKSWAIGANVHVYLIAATTVDCRITEGS